MDPPTQATVTHLIQSLPSDILLDIFPLCIDSKSDLLRLSHVCRFWRHSIHNCPTLWTKISLYIPGRDPEIQAQYWLERARLAPLTIAIHMAPDHARFTGDKEECKIVMSRIAQSLKDTTDRWIELDIGRGVSHELAQIFFSIVRGYASAMKRLHVDVAIGGERNLDISLERASGAKAEIEASFNPSFTPSFTPSFALSLVQLRFSFDLPETVWSCANLVELHLHGEFRTSRTSHVQWPSENHLNTLPHLSHLSFSYVDEAEALLSSLNLPSLKTFEFTTSSWGPSTSNLLLHTIRRYHTLSTFSIRSHSRSSLTSVTPHASMSTITLPNIECFTLTEKSSVAHSFLQHVIFPRVHVLDFAFTDFRHVHRLASSSTMLTSLELYAINLASIPLAPNIMIIPTLIDLKISGSPTVIDYLQTPALLTLAFSNVSKNLMPSLGSFIERSTPPLMCLSLLNVGISDNDLAQIVVNLPELSYIEFHRCPITDAFFQLVEMTTSTLSPREPVHPPLPNLEAIELTGTAITHRGLIDFLESRQRLALASGLTLALIEGYVHFDDLDIPSSDREMLKVCLSIFEVIVVVLTIPRG